VIKFKWGERIIMGRDGEDAVMASFRYKLVKV
jgi:hypothetical protein